MDVLGIGLAFAGLAVAIIFGFRSDTRKALAVNHMVGPTFSPEPDRLGLAHHDCAWK